jgi:hypothetical protein
MSEPETEARIVSLLVENLKQGVTKEEVVDRLRKEKIPIRAYNEVVMRILGNSGRPLVNKQSKRLDTREYLDESFLKNLVGASKRGGDRAAGRGTLYEEKDLPTRMYGSRRYASCRSRNRMLTTGEILHKLKDYASELGMEREASKECAEYLQRGLELYLRNLATACKGRMTVSTLKKALDKHLRLFNNLDGL